MDGTAKKLISDRGSSLRKSNKDAWLFVHRTALPTSMTRLVLETSISLTAVEVMEWFSSFGFGAYDVQPMHGGLRGDGKTYQFVATIRDQASRRAITVLQGRSIKGHVVVVRPDGTT